MEGFLRFITEFGYASANNMDQLLEARNAAATDMYTVVFDYLVVTA